MNNILLPEISILYIESMVFRNNCFDLEIKANNGQQNFVILFSHLLTFNFSKDSIDDDIYHEIDVLEIEHEYRILTASDLQKSSFHISIFDKWPKMNVVTIHGSGKVINLICKDIEIIALKEASIV
jgi:hypothetical protein